MRTLYAESYRIDGPDSRQRMPDPPVPPPDALPTAETLYAFQRDLSFGANVYAYSFACLPEAVRVDATNLTRMSFGIIPLLAPHALHTRLLVIQAVPEIGAEIQSFRACSVKDERDYVRAQRELSTVAQWLYFHLPRWLRLTILKRLIANPFRAKKYTGTVYVTTVNATGKLSG
jgi:Family of unknown function (DUF6675)